MLSAAFWVGWTTGLHSSIELDLSRVFLMRDVSNKVWISQGYSMLI